jgi:two-component system, chemotaxis family, protein-glutamate methylesterase/glutaminase
MIRVLIVDDSAVVRKYLADELSKFDDIEVVGGAIDPYAARDKIVSLQPDVLTLDLEMPRMDGLSFLAKLMRYYPLPVVVISSLTPKNSETALRALSLGAVEVIAKPGSQFSTPGIGPVVRAIRAAASAQMPHKASATRPQSANESSQPTPPEPIVLTHTTHKILAIGASTGGPQAVEVVLKGLPANSPGTVIVQHMPAGFTAAFAGRLNQVCAMEVREARDNDPVVPGMVLIAPGNYHMMLQMSGAKYMVRIKDGPPVYHQRPAVDVLFQSVASTAGRNALGVILTGMGADGAKGLKVMRDSGAYTIAQDEHSSTVFGMPKEAIKLGAVQDILPLNSIAPNVLKYLNQTN